MHINEKVVHSLSSSFTVGQSLLKAVLPFTPYGSFLASKNSNRAGHHLGLGKIPCRDVAEFDVLLTVSFLIQ